MEKRRKSFSEEVKRVIVEEIESGILSLREAAERGQTTVSCIKVWLEEYGRYKPKVDRVEVVMKSEEERIAELEKALAEAHLKLRVQEEIIVLAGKRYRVDLKKSFGGERLPQSGDKQEQVSTSYAKLPGKVGTRTTKPGKGVGSGRTGKRK